MPRKRHDSKRLGNNGFRIIGKFLRTKVTL